MRYSYGTFKQLDTTAAEALLLFCQVVNPLGNAFHPNKLKVVVEGWLQKKGPLCKKFFRQFHNIQGMLDKSWNNALNLHQASNPDGPLPKQILCKRDLALRYALTWHNWLGGGTIITLTFLGSGTSQRIFLAVTSKDLSVAKYYATLVKLPEPTIQQDLRPWFIPQPVLAPVPAQKSIWDTKIPLGDLLDFIQKYR